MQRYYTSPQSCLRTFCCFSAYALPTLLFPIFSQNVFCTCFLGTTVDSRYSGSLKYGHLDIPAILAWLGMLAICLLHKTHPEVRPLAIPYTGTAPPQIYCDFPVWRTNRTRRKQSSLALILEWLLGLEHWVLIMKVYIASVTLSTFFKCQQKTIPLVLNEIIIWKWRCNYKQDSRQGNVTWLSDLVYS